MKKNITIPQAGHVYFLKEYTAPKRFNGLYFECLLTDQKIPGYAEITTDLGHIDDYSGPIWNSKRFGIKQPQTA